MPVLATSTAILKYRDGEVFSVHIWPYRPVSAVNPSAFRPYVVVIVRPEFAQKAEYYGGDGTLCFTAYDDDGLAILGQLETDETTAPLVAGMRDRYTQYLADAPTSGPTP